VCIARKDACADKRNVELLGPVCHVLHSGIGLVIAYSQSEFGIASCGAMSLHLEALF
jgi:hypothetical protein